ncbi:MAG: hypothetical protein AABZ55_07565 [Bdellovibrionota bacterium]
MKTSRMQLFLTVSLFVTANAFAGELFPYDPPRSTDLNRSAERPYLSLESRKSISDIANRAKQLSPTEKTQFRRFILKMLSEALDVGELNKALYASTLLGEIE